MSFVKSDESPKVRVGSDYKYVKKVFKNDANFQYYTAEELNRMLERRPWVAQLLKLEMMSHHKKMEVYRNRTTDPVESYKCMLDYLTSIDILIIAGRAYVEDNERTKSDMSKVIYPSNANRPNSGSAD